MTNGDEVRIEHEMHRLDASNDPFAAAVRATRMPMLITDPRQPDNPIIFANDAFERLTGYGRDETLGQNCRFLQGPGTNDDDITRIRMAIAKREPIEIDLLNYRKDGSTFWNRLLISPVFRGDGELTYFFASQFDVSPDRRRMGELETSRAELESEVERRMLDLANNESRLRFILDAARMGTWTLDLETKRLVASAHCKANFGRDVTDGFSYTDLSNSIDPEYLGKWSETVERAIATSGEFEIEYRIVTPQGERRWIHVRGQTTYDAQDNAVGMAGISQDITVRKEAEEHRKLLARELNHRVKNSLATVQSIFSQSLNSARSIEEARSIVNGRMAAMSSAQDIITSEGLGSADLRQVVQQALRPLAEGRVRSAGPRVIMGAKAVSSFSLALHELATNAVKYGALSAPGGSVTITWDIAADNLEFEWVEMDGPAVSPPGRRGFGTRMIEKVLAIELNGKAELQFPPAGLRFYLSVPLQALGDEASNSLPASG